MTLLRLTNDVPEGRAFSIPRAEQSKEIDCPTLKMEVASPSDVLKAMLGEKNL